MDGHGQNLTPLATLVGRVLILLATMWGPQTIAKLANNSNNYGVSHANNELVFMGFININIHITGGAHIVYLKHPFSENPLSDVRWIYRTTQSLFTRTLGGHVMYT